MDRHNKNSAEENVFSEYAAYYDILYQDKDYAGESLFVADLIDGLMQKERKQIRILDLACGTGRHAMELTKLGYRVEGSDLSKEMIDVANMERKKGNYDIRYYTESFQTAERIGKKYDVVLSMFSAINYLTSYQDLSLALKNIHLLLDSGGIYIFDFWNGNAVIHDYSATKVKRMAKDDKEVVRISTTTIDKIAQTASLKFDFMLLQGSKITKEFREEHNLRYYFLQEMVDLLQANDFEVLLRCPFMDTHNNISASDWNVTYVVRKMPVQRRNQERCL